MKSRSKRLGVSIVEVLFAIGVVAVGLLGVISVFPVALHQIGRGNAADRGSALGLNAEEEFYARGMRNPAIWLAPMRPPAQAQLIHEGQNISPFANPGVSFCIDPQFVAANLTTGYLGSPYNPEIFPYLKPLNVNTQNEPRMVRMSIRGRLSRTVGTNQIFEIVRKPLADNICVLDDELSFDIPAEKTLPPTQQFGSGALRVSEGTFSWMATVVPIYDYTGAPHDSYYLSIVIFHHRDPRFAMYLDTNANGTWDTGELPTYNEWNASIPDTNFHAAGIRGGDVTIEGTTPESVELNVGNWVLLSRRLPLADASVTLTNAQGYFRWYRVAGAENDARQISPTLWQRDVTLEGGDWPINTNPNFSAPPTQVTIMKNIINVYERTIRLGQ